MYINPHKLQASVSANPALSDTMRLWVLHTMLRDRNWPDAINQRVALYAQMRDLAEDGGYIAIVNSGMDCDCSRWENSVSIVRVDEVQEWLDDFYANAEGPQGHYLERPSVARQLKRSSRDLALEAHENGHDHVVYL